MKISHRHVAVTHARPETDEILQRREGHVDAVDEGVGEEQEEELVVGETDTIVHPRTMMVHLEYTSATDRAVMCTIRLQSLAFITITHLSGDGSTLHRQISGSLHENLTTI